jgi:hypothetical protein
MLRKPCQFCAVPPHFGESECKINSGPPNVNGELPITICEEAPDYCILSFPPCSSSHHGLSFLSCSLRRLVASFPHSGINVEASAIRQVRVPSPSFNPYLILKSDSMDSSLHSSHMRTSCKLQILCGQCGFIRSMGCKPTAQPLSFPIVMP